MRIDGRESDAPLFPVSPFASHRVGHQKRGKSISGATVACSDTIVRMLEELDALAAKLAELSGRVLALREENQQLRAQLAAAQAHLETVTARVDQATARIDALLDRFPGDGAGAAVDRQVGP